MADVTKTDWLLLFLDQAPLDRIRLMKCLFLYWHRSGRGIEGFFKFVPYNYGPCSFELYRVLEEAQHDGFVTQAPHPPQNWARYFITERGKAHLSKAAHRIEPGEIEAVRRLVGDLAPLGFIDVLKRVYSEAPDFAVNSLVLSATK